jgi:hypothetical protein
MARRLWGSKDVCEQLPPVWDQIANHLPVGRAVGGAKTGNGFVKRMVQQGCSAIIEGVS